MKKSSGNGGRLRIAMLDEKRNSRDIVLHMYF